MINHIDHSLGNHQKTGEDERGTRARSTCRSNQDEGDLDLTGSPPSTTMAMQGIQEDKSCEGTFVGKEKDSMLSKLVGMLPFKRDSQHNPQNLDLQHRLSSFEELEEHAASLKQANQKLCTENEAARKEIVHHISEAKTAQEKLRETRSGAKRHIELLDHRIQSGTVLNERLQKEKRAGQHEIRRLHDVVTDMTTKLQVDQDAAQRETKRLQSLIHAANKKNAKLREMLIPISEKQVMDADVARKFASIRSSIVALVRQTWNLDLRCDVDFQKLPIDQRNFFDSGGPCSYNRLRSLVFSIIAKSIFNSRNYFLGSHAEGLQCRISQVESWLSRNLHQENRKLLLEWRNVSFKVTETFRDKEDRLSLSTQDQIWNFLDPLQVKDPAAEVIGRNKLKTICDQAVDFSLMIRQLKDDFWVEEMENAVGAPSSDWEEYIEEMASVAAGNNHEPGTIAYVMAGALIKTPKEDMEKILVLEKAEVAVYE